jgi:hypothetical protein
LSEKVNDFELRSLTVGVSESEGLHQAGLSLSCLSQSYFGNKPHWLGRVPLTSMLAPTTIGWLEVILIENATSGLEAGVEVASGATQFTSRVFAGFSETVAPSASPG